DFYIYGIRYTTFKYDVMASSDFNHKINIYLSAKCGEGVGEIKYTGNEKEFALTYAGEERTVIFCGDNQE
ncbi:MAG: hypothetical protein ACK5M3_14670, partial [Dysgonomonas sp.]